ncbi:NAD(P)-dependent oxidoreductase [Ancylobacter oerskovii]|uniref:NAD(P)-dependent oxidoreductase n=1 Tax=Ancylobacter oerskovii TaxID=459519 RepID=A0ABW4YW16_9HYPH|nr:NAD(P)-dependent oxidoreductase [Ancylobacter oerskovii]MBS7543093.1 NAD(P)-dependent oxidoreductase [Ancylobacter oerskovii]
MDSVLFIGAGRMGGLMAEHLADGGVPLAVVDLAEEALAPFRARGLPAATRAADLPGAVVITMLPTDRHVRDALLGPGGACTARTREVVIDMSTAAPSSTIALAGDLAGRGTAVLDAPVSGGMARARAGTLTAMVGGAPDAFARVRPLLDRMCGEVIHVGPVGSGHVIKALNNYLSAATLWSATEALIVGERFGLDPATMLKVWSAGSGTSHATQVKLPNHVLTGTYDFGQTLELFCKDISIAADLARRAEAETPTLDALLAFWSAARDRLGGQEDITAIARLIGDSRPEAGSMLGGGPAEPA